MQKGTFGEEGGTILFGKNSGDKAEIVGKRGFPGGKLQRKSGRKEQEIMPGKRNVAVRTAQDGIAPDREHDNEIGSGGECVADRNGVGDVSGRMDEKELRRAAGIGAKCKILSAGACEKTGVFTGDALEGKRRF